MTLLTLAQGLAKNVGLEVPTEVVTSDRREWIEFIEIANDACEEIARRVDWGTLRTIVPFVGNGLQVPYNIGTDASRIARGVSVTNSRGDIVRPLTASEWTTLGNDLGWPRYYFLLGSSISFWPIPSSGQDMTVLVQSKNWCLNGTDKFAVDADEPAFDEGLVLKGIITRWRRQKGMDYADYEAEYEAALRDFAEFDDRSRL